MVRCPGGVHLPRATTLASVDWPSCFSICSIAHFQAFVKRLSSVFDKNFYIFCVIQTVEQSLRNIMGEQYR